VAQRQIPWKRWRGFIGKLKDENGKILIPHFYDRVLKRARTSCRPWKSLPFNEEALPQDGSRLEGIDRRVWVLSAGAHLGGLRSRCMACRVDSLGQAARQ